ncbi:histidine kinase [Methylobacterium sp. A54F]
MADYYPLLARALDALPDRTSAMRRAVYDRARGALIGQLRSLEPPLSQADIDLESKALDAAIARLETKYAGDGAPPKDPAPPAPPAAAPEPPRPDPAPPPTPPAPPAAPPSVPFVAPPAPPAAPPLAQPEPAKAAEAPSDGLFEAEPAARAEPFLPPAPPPDLGLPPAPEPPRGPPAIAIAARRPKGADPAEPDATADAAPEAPAPVDPLLAEEAEAARAEAAGNGRQRPKIDVVAPRGSRSRMLRNTFVACVLALVIGLIAVAAYLLRDTPADLQTAESDVAGTAADGADAKYGDRVGGEAAPAERPPAATQGAEAPARPAQPGQPDLVVAQRATLIEENTSAQNAQPTTITGRATWRLDSVSGEQGQPLETAVVATVEYPEAGLTLVMTIQRNLDQTLPASHTIKLAFTTGPGGEKRAVQDVGLLQAKDEESARGSPVSGLPVRVRENLFLIGLSSLRNDIDRNTDLLLHKNWFDLALRFTSGQRAVITFEKGNSGAQAMQRAFDQWR